MSPAQTFPSAADAMATVRAGLRFLAAADATQMPVQTQAECLQMLEQANAISTAARTSILGAFTAGQGAAGRRRTGQGRAVEAATGDGP
jgi:hypothetical protein